VADYLGLTKGTVSQSLILLETKGLIGRGPDARDRRVVRLALTPLGRVLAESAQREGAAPWRTAAGALPKGLTEVQRRLQRLEGRRSFGACRTCRHHLTEGPERWRCGLTGEPLSQEDGERICREHAPTGA
jgi:DNA-binding MarR family transcriptional regulator